MTTDERYIIAYNGEIYNYLELQSECRAAGWSFRTTSDTEVLIACWALWGKAALTRLIGMFAFVLIDRFEGCAWIARDAFGIKPLHYAFGDSELLLCSEIPPIVSTGQVPLSIDPAQTAEYLRFGAASDPEGTLIQGICRFPRPRLPNSILKPGPCPNPYAIGRPKERSAKSA